MTKKEIATLSFKVLSLYAFIKAVDKLTYLTIDMKVQRLLKYIQTNK